MDNQLLDIGCCAVFCKGCTTSVFTSLVTYLSMTTPAHAIQRVLAFYIAATIAGGFFGRFLAGIMATYTHWQFVFLIIMLGLLWGYRLLFL
ncbi:MAG: hypothetical protein R3E08_10160 [Thiotrichaceae bacterium]